MGAFVDVYLPSSIPGYPCTGSPRTSTTITVASSGDEGRNKNWEQPLRRFKLPAAEARQWQIIADLTDHFLITDGPFASFPWRDPFDFASIRLAYANETTASILARIGGGDQVFGVGDGLTRTFQLTKTYQRGGYSKVRPIQLPVLSSLIILDAGGAAGSHSVSRPGGLVTFDVAPVANHVLTWGGLFDVPVRFDSDDAIDTVVAAYQVAGAAEINLDEQRSC